MDILQKIRYSTMEDVFLRVRDLKIRIRRRPVSGEVPVLLINGLGGCLEAWEPLTRLLDGRDIIAVDHPGCGLSSPPNQVLTMSELAEFYIAVLDMYGLEKVNLLGFSFGGTIVQQIAHEFPERVSSIILACTAPGAGGFPPDSLTTMVAANPMRYQMAIVREMSAPIIYRGRVGRHPRLFENELAGFDAHRTTMLGVGAQIGAFIGWSSLPWLGSIDKPTLVMGGEEDPMTPIANTKLIAAVMPGAELHVFEGCGHLLLFDRAELAAPVIIRFLDRVHPQAV